MLLKLSPLTPKLPLLSPTVKPLLMPYHKALLLLKPSQPMLKLQLLLITIQRLLILSYQTQLLLLPLLKILALSPISQPTLKILKYSFKKQPLKLLALVQLFHPSPQMLMLPKLSMTIQKFLLHSLPMKMLLLL